MTQFASNEVTRRLVLGGAGLAVAAAATGPALAQSGPGGSNGPSPQNSGQPPWEATGTVQPMQNPQDEYPTPPFPRQSQPWPGLVSRMQPRPDHGEHSYRGSGKLLWRRALITGGNSGMGRGAAIAYAREGADVAINYLPQEQSDADDVAHYIREAGRNAVLLPGDLRDEDFCKRLVADAVDQLGGLDILVSNAGRQVAQPSIEDITTEQFDDTFKTNVYAMFWITKAAVPHMPPGAAIINTASVEAYDPGKNLLDYASTKGAIMVWTKSLAKQLASKGIRVNGVAPGPIWTPLQVCGGQPESKLPDFGKSTPMGRAGEPVELAPLYVLLAAPELSYSTGQIFGAVGGNGGP